MRRLIARCALGTLAIPRVGSGQEAAPAEVPAVAPAVQTPTVAEEPVRKNHFVPIFDIVLFDFLVNRFGEHFIDRGTYDVDGSSIRHNLRGPWLRAA